MPFARTCAEEARVIALWNAGIVASAVRMMAKAELTGTIGKILPMVENSEETMLGNLTSEKGIGWPVRRPVVFWKAHHGVFC
jgi:hypothetical protein